MYINGIDCTVDMAYGTEVEPFAIPDEARSGAVDMDDDNSYFRYIVDYIFERFAAIQNGGQSQRSE